MARHPLAGKPAPPEILVNVPRLVSRYYTTRPDSSIPEQRVCFGTSWHRGTSLNGGFNEEHILATCQAVAEYRASAGIDGPLFLGMDTPALSEPALTTALEVLAANGVQLVVDRHLGVTPTPVVSHAILGHNRRGEGGQADGIIITPSHTPPDDGG